LSFYLKFLSTFKIHELYEVVLIKHIKIRKMVTLYRIISCNLNFTFDFFLYRMYRIEQTAETESVNLERNNKFVYLVQTPQKTFIICHQQYLLLYKLTRARARAHAHTR